MTRIFIRWCSLLLLGVVTLAYAEQISEQSLLLSLTHSGQAIKLEAVVVKNVPFHAPLPDTGFTYRYLLLSQDNRTLYTGSFHDPLDVYTDDFSDPARPRGGRITQNRATFILSAPYLPEAKRIRFQRQTAEDPQPVPMGESPLTLTAVRP